jgi:hypothetical protein
LESFVIDVVSVPILPSRGLAGISSSAQFSDTKVKPAKEGAPAFSSTPRVPRRMFLPIAGTNAMPSLPIGWAARKRTRERSPNAR